MLLTVSGCLWRRRWGQNNTEVTIKCRVPEGTKSRQVQLVTASQSIKLIVMGDVVCGGQLQRPIISDESTCAPGCL